MSPMFIEQLIHSNNKERTLSEFSLLRVEFKVIERVDNAPIIVFNAGQKVGFCDIIRKETLVHGIDNRGHERPNEGCRGFDCLDIFFTKVGEFGDIGEPVYELFGIMESFL
jgi:hypothetical protein